MYEIQWVFNHLIGALDPREVEIIGNLALALVCGLLIGGERELKGKPAGIRTQTLVISGSMLFAYLSHAYAGSDPTRIAAQIVSGIGFLGAGIIFRSRNDEVSNVTTAASVWYAAAVGMAIGFDFKFIALVAALYAVLVSRLPRLRAGDE